MRKVFAVLFLGLLASAVLLNRVDANLVTADQIRCPGGDCKKDKDKEDKETTLAHCGKCDGDKKDKEGDDDKSLAHDGDCKRDKKHDEEGDKSLAHCGKCDGDKDKHEDGEGDESLV